MANTIAVSLIAGNPFMGVATSVYLGIGKEVGDHYSKNNHFCWWDLLADVLGALAGLAIYKFIAWL